jgi:hypothetical protein
MSRPLKPACQLDVQDVQTALQCLRRARDLLRNVGAERSLARVRLAITSTGGALRHIQHRAS